MSEYMLVQKASLEELAKTIKEVSGDNTPLTFPNDFIAAIENLQIIVPESPTEQTVSLIFSNGTYTNGNFTGVGHYESMNYVSEWQFTPGINTTSAILEFDWANKTADGGPGVGYNDEITISFAVNGETAIHTIANKATPGPFTVSLTGLNLIAGQKYTVTVKEFMYGTVNNFKMFKKSGNKIHLTS